MTLDPSYLEYPHRRQGMDHDLYPFSNLFERKPLEWPGGAKLALVVMPCVEYFPLVPGEGPFKAPGHMATPYPDLRHYSSRDYGTRVGYYRFLEAFAKTGVTASVAMNAAIAQRYPAVASDTVEAGHEIVAHASDMNSVQYGGMDRQTEAAMIADTLDGLQSVTGKRPRGWRSIAQSQSENTLSLLAEAGLAWQSDWVNDDLPYAMTTAGGPIMNLPMNHELSDRQIVVTCQQSADSYAEQIRDAAQWLLDEADRHGGRMLALTLTPYVMGLPYRIDALDGLLGWLMEQPGVWSGSASEVIDVVKEQI